MKIIHCSLTCRNNLNGLCQLDKITINIDGCLCWEEEKLTIGTYENDLFEFNPEFDHDFLDNPDLLHLLMKDLFMMIQDYIFLVMKMIIVKL